MKRILIALSALFALSLGAGAQVMTHQIVVPDIEGYLTLKGDMHTIPYSQTATYGLQPGWMKPSWTVWISS